MKNDFYIYIWKRPCGTPFYVGKGSGGRVISLENRNQHFSNIVTKIIASGKEPIVERSTSNMTEAEAFDAERALIAKYGRASMGGLLCNMTDGGEGASGLIRDEDTRRKMSHAKRMSGPLAGQYKGVALHKASGMWRAKIRIDGQVVSLGESRTAERAARLYDKAAHCAWGNDCYLNFPDLIGEPIPSGADRAKSALMRGPRTGAYKGVSFVNSRAKWGVEISVAGKKKCHGFYSTPEQAAKVYDRAAIEAWGYGNCYLNFPQELSPA